MTSTNWLALLLAAGLYATSSSRASADTFGSGINTFDIEFVDIGNPGNPADTSGAPNPAGSVAYAFRMGKYEISEQMIDKANALGGLGITKILRGPDKPATSVSWNEACRFINWLNTSTGSAPAYKFAIQPGEVGYNANANIELWTISDSGYNPNNSYRNSKAAYFLPSDNEWYKAAFFDPNGGVYYDYPTGSNSVPTAVASGMVAGTAVYGQGIAPGPADIKLAGGLSPYGTMGQAGNAWEWEETDFDRVNDSSSSVRESRGGSWNFFSDFLPATWRDGNLPATEVNEVGFRVATSYVEFAVAGPDNSAFVMGSRPGNGGIPAPPETITLLSLDVLDGSSFTLDPHETLVLTSSPLYIAPGAVFTGNGIVQGGIINAGLLRIPIVRIQTVSQTSGGFVEVQLPAPAMPGAPIIMSGDFGVAEDTLVSFAGGGGGGGGVPSPIVLEGTPQPNEGVIRWDASLEVTGSFEQRATGALRMFIGGHDMPGVNYSQLTVGEGVTLAGAIELVLQPELFGEFGYVPMVGDTFDLIVAAQGITIADSGLTLRSLSTEAGASLIQNLTFSPFTSGIAADPDHLFQINESIFEWRLVENNTILRATLVYVPEPTSSFLLLTGICATIASHRRTNGGRHC